jgi:hypothetical protein
MVSPPNLTLVVLAADDATLMVGALSSAGGRFAVFK